MGEVVVWKGVTTENIPPERVLNAALSSELTDVVVLGYDSDGQEYFASSIANGPDVLWLLERLKLKLLKRVGED